jgi:hypothetical protein
MRPVVQLLVLLAASTAGAASPVTVVRAARLYDGKSDAVVTPGVIVVSEGKIVAAGTRADVPPGAKVIDLGDATLLPGLIDAHTHLSFESSLDWKQDQLDLLKKPITEQAIDATEFARRTLLPEYMRSISRRYHSVSFFRPTSQLRHSREQREAEMDLSNLEGRHRELSVVPGWADSSN